jgi:glutamate synthase (NADPH/NADH) small chain
MQLGEPDGSGRRRPVPVPDSSFELETDMVVYAIGTNANPIIGQTSGLKLDQRGYIATDENLATSLAGVFAGGDIVTGAATVIKAMGAGRLAARGMKAWLGLRDSEGALGAPSMDADQPPDERPFGIPRRERGYARLHIAQAPTAPTP